MTAQIITVVAQKGGAGKSTVAMTVAGEMGRRGLRVLVVDTDAQGTAMRWAAAAEDNKPFPATVVGLSAAGAKVHRELKQHVENYDVIVVDCPPSVESPVPESALLVSNIALVPVPLSPADVWATVGITKVIERAQVLNEDLRGYLVANRVQRTAIAAEALEALKKFSLPMLKTQLGLRAAFQEACLAGCTVADLGSAAKAARDEVDALTTEIQALLTKENTHV